MRINVLSIIATLLLLGAPVTVAQDYSEMFDEAIEANNKILMDSIITLWESSAPDDTDLAIAKFQRQLIDIYKPVVTKARDKKADNDSTYLITVDHVIDRDALAKAYAIIDRAIEANPDVFKLRQHKIFKDYKLKLYAEFISDFDRAFSRQSVNGGKWVVEDSYYPEIPRDEVIMSLAIGYLNDILDQDSVDIDLAEQILDTGLKYFPEDFRLLNVYGVIAANYRYDPVAAIDYYNRALATEPDDFLIMLNLAHTKLNIGDSNSAIELANKVILSPHAPKSYKDEAQEIIEYANMEKTPVSLYSFQFQYAPVLAASATSPFKLTDVAAIIDEWLPAAGFVPKFSSKIVSSSLLTIGDKECVVWTFDTPTETPLCKYLAFIPVDGHYEVYTLEKTLALQEGINWVIGHPTEEMHSSLGGAKGFDSGEDFVNYVLDHFIK